MENKKNLYKALADFQQEVPVLLKGTDGYGYKYIQLEHIIAQINPLLKKHKLGFTQLIEHQGLTTVLFHYPSGEAMESNCTIPECDMKGMNKFQSAGAGITYFRRYALSSMLGIISDTDTDAKIYTSKPLRSNFKEIKKPTVTKLQLEVGSENWKSVLMYMANPNIKALGLPAIVEQLEAKYNIPAKVKKELSKSL